MGNVRRLASSKRSRPEESLPVTREDHKSKGTKGGKRSAFLAVLALLAVSVQQEWYLTSPTDTTSTSTSGSAVLDDKKHSGDSNDSRSMRQVLLQNADAKIQERRDWLSTSHSEGRQFSSLRKESAWYMFTPVLPCFWTFEKQPSSAVLHDGGKWLCGLQQVHSLRSKPDTQYGPGSNHYSSSSSNKTASCIVYSFGSSNRFDFEERVRKVAPGCEIHTFDPTVPETGKGKGIYDAYHGDYGFGGEDGTVGGLRVKTLGTILKELNHDHVDYLKIDVEGYEWDFLDTVDWSQLKVGQILVELHPGIGERRKTNSGPKYIPTAGAMNQIFIKLEDAGFRLISLEPVTYTNYGQVELVFLHKDWMPSGDW